MTKKFKFSIDGTEFQLPISQVQVDTYSDTPKEKYIHMNAKSTASVIKQYIKKHYPTLKVWATSSVYSGGSSVDINISKPNSPKVDKWIESDIDAFSNKLKNGTFNGMIDMYETREDSPTTDNGTPMKYFPSYVFVNNKPKWGSYEYWLNEFWYSGEKLSIDDFLSKNKTYMTDKEYSKVELNLKSI